MYKLYNEFITQNRKTLLYSSRLVLHQSKKNSRKKTTKNKIEQQKEIGI